MKKSILAIAVAATIAAPAAMAAPTLYGNVNLSLDAYDNDVIGADNNIAMHSNTSAIGVKGSEDLGDGLKAIYKVEFGINLLGPPIPEPDFAWQDNRFAPEGTGALIGRDQFIGLKAGWGTVKLGTFSSNYKQMGGKVDPLYRTPLEGRGFLDIQSSLHRGRGINNGRMTNAVSYTTPKMGGFSLVANTTFSGSNDETTGVGIRWSNKAFMVYADWIDAQQGSGAQLCESAAACTPQSAAKLGGKWTTKAFALALQYEAAQDLTAPVGTTDGVGGSDFIFAAGTWNINKNNALILTYGMTDVKEAAGDSSEDSTGIALAYNHKMSKMTNVYVGYGAKSSDETFVAGDDRTSGDESVLTAGMRVKF